MGLGDVPRVRFPFPCSLHLPSPVSRLPVSGDLRRYLDFLETRHTACDFLAMACHVPLRVYVMGDRAEKTATPDELARMRALVAEAVEHGAVGLSTSRTLLHRDLEGTVVPGTYADRVELTELMAGLAQGGGGLFEMVQVAN